MTRTLFALCCFLIAATISCNKIDQPQTTSGELLGTWTLYQFGIDDNGSGNIAQWETSPVAAGYVDKLTFNKNGTGNELTIINKDTTQPPLEFTWTLSAKDTLTTIGTGHDTIIYYLNTISESQLTLIEIASSGLACRYYHK